VGQRHGTPVVLVIDSQRMFDAGCLFFRSENGVWLTTSVPLVYIVRIDR
jgi:putative RNA 2'-phosphotransferase